MINFRLRPFLTTTLALCALIFSSTPLYSRDWSGEIQICNKTGYGISRKEDTFHDMDQWDFPEIVDAKSSAVGKFAFHVSAWSNPNQDCGSVTYLVNDHNNSCSEFKISAYVRDGEAYYAIEPLGAMQEQFILTPEAEFRFINRDSLPTSIYIIAAAGGTCADRSLNLDCQ